MLTIDKYAYDRAMDSVSTGWPTNKDVTLFLRKLRKNATFEEKFNARLKELLDGPFSYTQTSPHLVEIKSVLNEEIENQVDRFDLLESTIAWENNSRFIDRFFLERPCTLLSEFCETDPDEVLTFPNPTSGNFQIAFDSESSEFGKIEILDLTGRIMYQKSIEIEVGFNNIHIDDFNELPGIYYISIRSADLFLGDKFVVK